MENNKLNHRVSFNIDENVSERIKKINIDPREVFLFGLESCELQISKGFHVFTKKLPTSKMQKLVFILNEGEQE